ncbi:hypothetical protein RWV98_02230 [Agathobaculum sp. NTUH-O15-33]|uniref:hypothetical protein n=1 Tax=Agathobaculum sp. NTUH-O15-33 TaxID=3079302 RepID=UPI0029585BAB|nr:hypothetical protein [Agathobaculum sp. NTUH-O15-33]WNX85116.1 hypothetical protein RWV98_02230 [Agathobaculum sp. NTUH-O15-33]
MAIHKRSLLDKLAEQCGAARVSDLHDMDSGQQKRLIEILLAAPPDTTALSEWNQALGYLTGAKPQKSVEAAHARLVILLTHARGKRQAKE